MTDAYTLLIIENSQPNLEVSLRSIIHLCGLTVGHPDTGLVSAGIGREWLSNLPPERLYDAIPSRQAFTLQLWWEGYWDVICIISRSDRYISLNFSLDGVREDDQDRLSSALARVADECAKFVIAVVIDLTGATAELDIESILTSGIPATEPFPDFLLVALRSVDPHAYLSNSLLLTPINNYLGRVTRIDNSTVGS